MLLELPAEDRSRTIYVNVEHVMMVLPADGGRARLVLVNGREEVVGRPPSEVYDLIRAEAAAARGRKRKPKGKR